MAGPTRPDVGHFLDETGVVEDNISPLGGAIDLDAPIADELEGGLFDGLPIQPEGGADVVYFAVAWKALDVAVTGFLVDPAIYNRAGLKPNSSAGVVQIDRLDEEDDGDVIITGKEDIEQTAWEQETISLAAVTSTGSTPFDALSIIRAEYVKDGVAAKPRRPLTISVDDEVIAVIFGTGLPTSSDTARGNVMCSAEYRLAIADDINTEIGWSAANNRLTAPDENVGAFDYATRWTDGDDSLPVASDMTGGDAINYCAELTVYAGVPLPVGGVWVLDVDLVGDSYDEVPGSGS